MKVNGSGMLATMAESAKHVATSEASSDELSNYEKHNSLRTLPGVKQMKI